MSTENNSEEINSIIDELKAEEVRPPIHLKPVEVEEINDSNVGDYVYRKSSELVESTLGAVQALKENVITGSDPKEIAALSQLINAASKALEQLNKINIQNKQSKNNLEMKKMEIEANNNRPVLPNTTNVMIATRDEILSQIFDKPKKITNGDVIDGEIIN